jgi:DNA-binding NtrC family response regulator
MNNKLNIIAIDDDEHSLKNIVLSVKALGHNVTAYLSSQKAIDKIQNTDFDIAIVDIIMPGKDGITLIKETKSIKPDLKFILITGYSDETNLIRGIKLGVDDFLKKPYNIEELDAAIKKIIKIKEIERENKRLTEILKKENQFLNIQYSKNNNSEEDDFIVGNSKIMKNLYLQAQRASMHSLDILISGESGVGKEVLAKFIHKTGSRANKPFVPINCASLSPSLFEAELFGYEKGAYTGAINSQAGLFEIADGGILFLDEVTEITPELQAKLLRVVETKTVRRVGSNNEFKFDVQIIATTNRDVEAAIKEKTFRSDLYFRLANFELYIPPLRERTGDFELLINYFLKIYSKKFNYTLKPIPPEYMEKLKTLEWPGNIRQLSTFIQKWVLFADSDFFISPFEKNGKTDNSANGKFSFYMEELTMAELNKVKKTLIEKVLEKYDGNKSRTAKHLGLSYAGLLKMLKGFS